MGKVFTPTSGDSGCCRRVPTPSAGPGNFPIIFCDYLGRVNYRPKRGIDTLDQANSNMGGTPQAFCLLTGMA